MKLWVTLGVVLLLWARRREQMVNEFDKQKRMEQRNMQNDEIEEFYNKKVRFLLYDINGKEFD